MCLSTHNNFHKSKLDRVRSCRWALVCSLWKDSVRAIKRRCRISKMCCRQDRRVGETWALTTRNVVELEHRMELRRNLLISNELIYAPPTPLAVYCYSEKKRSTFTTLFVVRKRSRWSNECWSFLFLCLELLHSSTQTVICCLRLRSVITVIDESFRDNIMLPVKSTNEDIAADHRQIGDVVMVSLNT